MKWMLLAALSLAGSPARPAAPDCELHVWPSFATAATNGGWASNLGLAGAMADYEHNKDQNLRDQVALIEALTPVVQARLIADADLPKLLGLAGASLVLESRPLGRQPAAPPKARRSASSAPCYAELIVSLNAYRKSSLYGRLLVTSFIFRDFSGGAGKVRTVTGRGSNAVPHFARLDTGDAEAKRELGDAFAANLRTFAAKAARR